LSSHFSGKGARPAGRIIDSDIETGNPGGDKVKCPRCGADNADRAERCYLCEYPFAQAAGTGEPPAPDEAVQPRYAPPVEVAPGQQAAPPAPIQGIAYQPPPPGAYAPGYQPPPPATKGPVTVKVVIMAVVVVVGLILAIGAYFLLRSDLYRIEVPTPPGYEVASDEVYDELNKSMDAESEDIEIDYLFVDNTQSNFVIVAREDIPTTFSSDAPPSDDPEAMEEWFNENKDEWVDAFEEGVALGGGMSSELDVYEVERLAVGDAVLHMAMSVGVMNTPFYIDTLWIVKGDTAFFILIEGLNKNPDTVEFLKENITFTK
jgi:hypothetical protein